MSLITGIPIRDSIHTDFSTGISGWEGYRTELTGEFIRKGVNVSGRYGEFSKDIQEFNRKIDTLSGAWNDTGMFLTPYNEGFRYTGTGDFNKWDTYSLDFDGVDDKLALPTSFSEWSEREQKTLSVWVKNGGNTSAARIFNTAYQDPDNTAFALGIGESSNTPFYFFRTAAGVYLKADFGDEMDTTNWYHLALVQDGTADEAYAYQNGVLKATISNVGEITVTSTTNAVIGSHWAATASSFFDGIIDECAIFNSALSAVDIRAIYNGGTPQSLAPYSPEAWWRMGDGPSDGNGLIGDQMNLTLGSELVLDDPYEAARWHATSTNTESFVAGESVRFDRPASGGSSEGGNTYFIFHAIGCLKETLAPDTTYEVTFTLESDDDNIGADILGSVWAGHTYSTTGAGVKTMYFHTQPTTVGSPYIMFYNLSNSKYVKLSGLSVKKVNGYAGGMINMTASDIVADTP